jgi:myo-inositol 2-dehydrogenase / D-chiro-inositol 1-dehydrogenase
VPAKGYPGPTVRQTRVGLVGAGAVARRHAATLSRFDDVVLCGITDVRRAAAVSLSEQTGAPVCDDVAALLDHRAPDAVYVCVPPFAHGEIEHALIDRALPFFVEKPLAADLVTAEDVARRVADVRLVTATGYHWRYLDGADRARRLLAQTPARLVVAAWLDKVPPPAWWTRAAFSGGQVIEQTTHVLDTMLDLLGDVEHVYSVAARTGRADGPEADIDDVSAAALRFASGAVGSVASTCLLNSRHRAGLELFCDGRRLELTDTQLVVDDGDGPVVHAEAGEAKRRVDRAFIDVVQGRDDDVRAPYGEALRTQRLAWALTRSAREQRAVALRRTPR